MAGGQGVHLKISWRKTLMEGPSQKIFKNGGWLCLTDAKRYYTTLQFWQVTGSADGVYPGYLARFSPYLVSYAGCGRDARVPRGDSPNMDRTPRDPRGICNNLGCTRENRRNPEEGGPCQSAPVRKRRHQQAGLQLGLARGTCRSGCREHFTRYGLACTRAGVRMQTGGRGRDFLSNTIIKCLECPLLPPL